VGDIRIGTSGWRYPPWRGPFYPRRWPQARELEYASRRVGSVEINGSFYSLQHPDSYRAWRDATPDDFVFAVKGGRFITHMTFDNDVKVRAPFDAMALAHRLQLGLRPAPPPDLASVREAPRTRWPGFGRARDQGAVPGTPHRRSQPSRTE
jgi:Protein of unknown function DUF72